MGTIERCLYLDISFCQLEKDQFIIWTQGLRVKYGQIRQYQAERNQSSDFCSFRQIRLANKLFQILATSITRQKKVTYVIYHCIIALITIFTVTFSSTRLNEINVQFLFLSLEAHRAEDKLIQIQVSSTRGTSGSRGRTRRPPP